MTDDIASIVSSTRIRFARNLKGFPFPNKITSLEQANKMIEKVEKAISDIPLFGGMKRIDMRLLNEIDARKLMENYVISKAVTENDYACVFVNRNYHESALDDVGDDVIISIMVNEEDVLREQYIANGFRLQEVLSLALSADLELEQRLGFAFDEKFGYLTACPSNLGTGLRASVMMFLPALTLDGRIRQIIRNMAHEMFTFRGVYGEGSEAQGYLYQVSNEFTLGEGVWETVHELEENVLKIAAMEKDARRSLAKNYDYELYDKCHRAYGLLSNAYLLGYDEFVTNLAMVKLGCCLDMFRCEDFGLFDELLYKMREANVCLSSNGMPFTPNERRQYRAEYVRCAMRDLIKEV